MRLRARLRKQERARPKAKAQGVTALKFQLPDLLEWIETNAKLTRAVKHMEMLRRRSGTRHRFRSRLPCAAESHVAAILLREIEPYHLLFAEEVCPPETFQRWPVRPAFDDTDCHGRTIDRGLWLC